MKLLTVVVLCLFSWSSAGPLRSEEEVDSRVRRQVQQVGLTGRPADFTIPPSANSSIVYDADARNLAKDIMAELNSSDFSSLETQIREYEINGTDATNTSAAETAALAQFAKDYAKQAQAQHAEWTKDPDRWMANTWAHENDGIPTTPANPIRFARYVVMPQVDRPRRHFPSARHPRQPLPEHLPPPPKESTPHRNQIPRPNDKKE